METLRRCAAVAREQGARIYETAVRLLTAYGMEVGEPWCRARVAGGDGVRAEGERVFFTEATIRDRIPFGAEEASGFRIDRTEDSFISGRPGTSAERDGYRYRVGGFALSVFDAEAQAVRPSTMDDVVEALRLCHVLGIGGPYPCTPTDLPPALRNVAAHYLCFVHSAVNCTHVCAGVEQAAYIYEMHRAMDVQMPLTLTVVTPFRVERTNLEVIRHFVEAGAPAGALRIVPVGYGLGGLNYPISLAGCWAMCLAEHMGLYLVATLLGTDFDVAPSVGLVAQAPVDYRSMAIALGNPNQVLYHYVNEILSRVALGRAWRAEEHAEIGLWTGSPAPDAQAAAEKTASALFGTLQGARLFGRLGNLCVDDVFSCEAMLLDREILDYARKAADAFGKTDAFLDLEDLEAEVAEAMAEDGSYMMTETTLRHLRTVGAPQEFFVHAKLASLAETRASRLPDALREARRNHLKRYDYALDRERRGDMERIYAAAAKAVAG